MPADRIQRLFNYTKLFIKPEELQSPHAVYSLLNDAIAGRLDGQIQELEQKLRGATDAQDLVASELENTLRGVLNIENRNEFIRNLQRMVKSRLPLDSTSQTYNSLRRLSSVRKFVGSNPKIAETLRELDLSLVPERWTIMASDDEAGRLELPESVLYIPSR